MVLALHWIACLKILTIGFSTLMPLLKATEIIGDIFLGRYLFTVPEGIFYFLLGFIPEWRGRYSRKWLKTNLRKEYSSVYAFVYSAECLRFADWIAGTLGIPLLIHLADHSKEFESIQITKTLRKCSKLICITVEMQKNYESMLGRKDIEVLHNGAESRCLNIPRPKKPPFNKDNPFRFCFWEVSFLIFMETASKTFFKRLKKLRKNITGLSFISMDKYNQQIFSMSFFRRMGLSIMGSSCHLIRNLKSWNWLTVL